MNIFINDTESLLARRLIECANEQNHRVVAAKKQSTDELQGSRDNLREAKNFPTYLAWNPASVFSTRLVLRQCSYLLGEDQAIYYIIILQSSFNSPSLQRSSLIEVQNCLESEFYGNLLLLREIETRRQELHPEQLERHRLVFVVQAENPSIEPLETGVYQGLFHCFEHILTNSNDENVFGFISKSSNFEAYSHFIVNYLENPSAKHNKRWLYFKDSWVLGSSGKKGRR